MQSETTRITYANALRFRRGRSLRDCATAMSDDNLHHIEDNAERRGPSAARSAWFGSTCMCYVLSLAWPTWRPPPADDVFTRVSVRTRLENHNYDQWCSQCISKFIQRRLDRLLKPISSAMRRLWAPIRISVIHLYTRWRK